MSFGARLAGLFALLVVSLGSTAGSIWVRGSDHLYQIDSATNRLVRSLTVDGGGAVAADEGGAWVLAKEKLVRHEAPGTSAWSLDVAPLLKQPSFLAIDPRGHHLWVVGKDGLLLLSLPERTPAKFPFAGNNVRAAVAGLDGSLWVLGNKELWHYSTQGALLARIDLHPLATSEPKFLAVDSLGDRLWLAGEKSVIRFDSATPSSALLPITLPDKAEAIALDARSGTVWIAGNDRLHVLGADGTLSRSVDLKAAGIKGVVGLSFDSTTSSLWAIHDGSASRLSAEGMLLATVPLAKNPEALAVAPLKLEPTVSIVTPADGTVTANAKPPLVLRYGVDCSGTPCGFGIDAISGYQLSASLNGGPPAAPFTFDPATGEATSVSATRLPEGANLLEVRVSDRFGNVSDPAVSRFTIDTTPPRFVSLSPADGSTVTTPTLSISGSVDEAATITLAGDGVAASVQGTSFTFPVTLRIGSNSYTLAATDSAGNRAEFPVRYTFGGLQIAISSPQDGASLPPGTAVVRGTVEAPDNTGILVNGALATRTGNQFFALIDLGPGANAISASAFAPDGTTASASVNVQATGSWPVEFAFVPNAGIAPFAAEVRIPVTPGRADSLTRIDFDGDGVFDSYLSGYQELARFTYSTPGTYEARITHSEASGATTSWAIPVLVENVRDIDQRLRAIVTGMFERLRARDIEGALRYIEPGSAERFRPMFEAMRENLPSIVDRIGTFADGRIVGDIAEYIIVRERPNGRQAFYLYLKRGADGIWRIAQM